jgi:translation initiation factor IF-1
MLRADAFKVKGVVVEVLSARTFRVELANGHRLLGFVPSKGRSSLVTPAVGDRVKLELSPYDLSEGRIVMERKTI